MATFFYIVIGFIMGWLFFYFLFRLKKYSGKLIISENGSKWILDMDKTYEEIKKRRYIIIKVYISH